MAKKSRKLIERDEQIYQITTLVAGSFSLQQVLDRLAEAAVKIVTVKACSIRLLDDQAGELKMRSTFSLSPAYRDKGIVSKKDPVIKAAFEGQAIVLDDMRVDDRVKYKQATIKEGLVSQLTVAMEFRDKPIGILRLYSPKSKRFDDDDIALARVVASQCAIAIINARLYAEAVEGAHIAEQMRLAGAIQRRMLPSEPPSIDGLDIAATYIPCFEVGGDFYDFLQTSPHSVSIVIADVMGKGIPAALMMSCLRGSVRAYADNDDGGRGVARIVNKLNAAACRECKDGAFISLLYAAIDTEDNSISYCSCGHEPAVLMRDNAVIDLDKGGLVLGVEPRAEYEVDAVQLRPGDTLLFYTDGLIDAANFDGELWGKENMLSAAQQFIDCPAEQMVKNILGYRRRFVGLASQSDDTSMVVVKVAK